MGEKKGNSNSKRDNLLKAVSERKSEIVHLSHNDLDAAGCDAVHRMKYSEIFTIWSSVGSFPSMLRDISALPGKGHLLSISDLGYCKDADKLVEKAVKNGWRICWRDHHRWTDKELCSIENTGAICIVDTTRCATAICAGDLMPGDTIAEEVARVVCDYDLWKHNDPRAKMLGQICTKRVNLNPVRDRLTKGIITDDWINEEYRNIETERKDAIKKSIRGMKIIESRYRVAFAPLHGYPSETAHEIRDEFNTDIEVIYGKNGRFSIRSVPPISHLIARKFSGGGHPPAAGGTFTFTLKDKMSLLFLKKSRCFNELVQVADTATAE
ncbi:phosphoesterase [Methanogenium organophilum]|uniref:Phosphoesterase n=1 Tax=Methanogenium organophilum TaxID=2199 RepID=A0A9X9T778_METOG|nr:phosphoesterase [Methanogenium organophilum]WAI00759.1 phosphoesterase [Methanogenium organophilum]